MKSDFKIEVAPFQNLVSKTRAEYRNLLARFEQLTFLMALFIDCGNFLRFFLDFLITTVFLFKDNLLEFEFVKSFIEVCELNLQFVIYSFLSMVW